MGMEHRHVRGDREPIFPFPLFTHRNAAGSFAGILVLGLWTTAAVRSIFYRKIAYSAWEKVSPGRLPIFPVVVGKGNSRFRLERRVNTMRCSRQLGRGERMSAVAVGVLRPEWDESEQQRMFV